MPVWRCLLYTSVVLVLGNPTKSDLWRENAAIAATILQLACVDRAPGALPLWFTESRFTAELCTESDTVRFFQDLFFQLDVTESSSEFVSGRGQTIVVVGGCPFPRRRSRKVCIKKRGES